MSAWHLVWLVPGLVSAGFVAGSAWTGYRRPTVDEWARQCEQHALERDLRICAETSLDRVRDGLREVQTTLRLALEELRGRQDRLRGEAARRMETTP